MLWEGAQNSTRWKHKYMLNIWTFYTCESGIFRPKQQCWAWWGWWFEQQELQCKMKKGNIQLVPAMFWLSSVFFRSVFITEERTFSKCHNIRVAVSTSLYSTVHYSQFLGGGVSHSTRLRPSSLEGAHLLKTSVAALCSPLQNNSKVCGAKKMRRLSSV